MIRHIVAWRLHESALGNGKAENARLMKAKLEALRGRIPGLLRLDVGLDFSVTDYCADVVLVSEFESREALAAYQVHPEHKKVSLLVRAVVCERSLIDCEAD